MGIKFFIIIYTYFFKKPIDYFFFNDIISSIKILYKKSEGVIMKKEEYNLENNIKVNQTEKINIAIEPGLKKSFKIKCIENNTEMSKVLKNFIYEYIK